MNSNIIYWVANFIELLLEIILFIVFSKALYKAFKKKISNRFVAKLIGLLLADIIVLLVSIIFSETINMFINGSLTPVSFGVYSLPIIRRFLLLIDNIKFGPASMTFYINRLKEALYSNYYFDSYMAWSAYDLIMYVLSIIKNIIIGLFIVIFFFKKDKADRVKAKEVVKEIVNVEPAAPVVEPVVEQTQAEVKPDPTPSSGPVPAPAKKKIHINDAQAIEELKKYKELYDKEILTKEEFERKKKQILGID